MQKEITVREFKDVVNTVSNIKQCQKENFLNILEKSKKEYKEGKFHSAKCVFKELKNKYGY